MSTSNIERRRKAQQASSMHYTGSQTPSQRRRGRRSRRPEPGSLYDTMRANSGMSLYVLPICWTDSHTRLLGAEFVSLPPVLTPVPPTNSSAGAAHGGCYPRPSVTAGVLSRDLTALISNEESRPFFKSRAIKSVMAILYPNALSKPKTTAEMDLYFGGRVFRKAVRVPVLWKHPDAAGTSFDSAITRPASSFGGIPSGGRASGGGDWSSSSSQATPNPPMLAYVNRTQLAFIRQNLFRVVPGPEGGDRSNTPVSRLQQLRSKLLMPSDPDHDAHYLAILLAMAQAHFYAETTSSRASSQASCRSGSRSPPLHSLPTPDFRDVKVQIITHSDDTAEFVVYTAVISASFLRRFAEPARAPLDAAGFRVEYAKVPIWPILGLKERLGKALGRDIAGDIPDDGSMETWESQAEREEREHRMNSLKRRWGERGALAEVLSGSFEAESDSGRVTERSRSPRSPRSPHSS